MCARAPLPIRRCRLLSLSCFSFQPFVHDGAEHEEDEDDGAPFPALVRKLLDVEARFRADEAGVCGWFETWLGEIWELWARCVRGYEEELGVLCEGSRLGRCFGRTKGAEEACSTWLDEVSREHCDASAEEG